MSDAHTVADPDTWNRERNAAFRFTRLIGDQKRRTSSLAEVMGDADLAQQTWLFVSPHDDDLCIGAGLFMQAAVREGVDVQILIVTDGCLGYCRGDQREGIAEIRHRETIESFDVLGISQQDVTYIAYPDGGLLPYSGRRPARPGEPSIEGYIGLQNAFTYYLRKFRPTRVFVPTHTDLHPDHRITHSELMISLFHASGAIWPELGAPLIDVPKVGELAVYCDFAESPNLEIVGNEEVFRTKLRSIEMYRSQVQISALVASLRSAGPYEYVRESEFRLFTPENYKHMFA
ncbi:MAG: PIG-L family deacetylase [Planctomycetes bacterium]|nr:PIG-L family deacetylase [Planctomycetota bacterium]